MRRVWKALVIAIAVTLGSIACSSTEDVPSLERRAQELNKDIMCPVCPGESIDQSQNELAAQMRDVVATKLEEGWSEAQIKDFFAERYGESVLMEPPRRGISLAVWIVPPVSVFAAGLALVAALRVMRRPIQPQTGPNGEAAGLSDEERDRYFSRVEAALGDDVVTMPSGSHAGGLEASRKPLDD